MNATSTKELVHKSSIGSGHSAPLPEHIFEDTTAYLQVVRNGLSGKDLQVIVQTHGTMPEFRELFIKLLETTSGNLHRYYKRATLSPAETEKILDTLELFRFAEKVFGDRDLAREWLNTSIPALAGEKPIALSDTFKGRKLIRDALQKIEYGDFS